MSNPRLIVLPEAEDDIKAILNYTLETWGWDQYLETAERIASVLEVISDNQEIGVARSDLPNGMRSFPLEKYIVFYFIAEGTAKVARIAHQRQNAKNIFKNP